MIEMIAYGSNGLTFKYLDQGMTCEGKLDGKDYPCTGPMLPPGFTSAVKDSGRSLDLVVKKDGKAFFTGTYTVRNRRPRQRWREVQDCVRPHVAGAPPAESFEPGSAGLEAYATERVR